MNWVAAMCGDIKRCGFVVQVRRTKVLWVAGSSATEGWCSARPIPASSYASSLSIRPQQPSRYVRFSGIGSLRACGDSLGHHHPFWVVRLQLDLLDCVEERELS